MEVKILRGASGAGKSTYVKNNFPNAYVCSADHFFIKNNQYVFNKSELSNAHGQCLRKYVEAILRNEPFIVVDNTNTTVSEISPYASIASAYKYDCEIITLLCDPNVAADRNIHGVPLKSVKDMVYRIERFSKSIPSYWKHKIIDYK